MRYMEQGIDPGSFLQAVLCNDLRQAVASADSTNRTKLADIVQWLYGEAPSSSWGSEENVRVYARVAQARQS